MTEVVSYPGIEDTSSSMHMFEARENRGVHTEQQH